MRRPVLLGIAFAAVTAFAAAAIAYAMLGGLPFGGGAPPRAAALPRGYVGMASFGAWRLICSPRAPRPASPQPAAAAAPTPSNQCRINHEVVDATRPGEVIVAANLVLAGPAGKPAVVFRLPRTAHDGDEVVLRADRTSRARAIVRGCTEGECVAVGELTADGWERVVAAGTLQVAFPARNRQRVLVEIPTRGLADAAAAMKAAQT
jgi:invasion protein IalB